MEGSHRALLGAVTFEIYLIYENILSKSNDLTKGHRWEFLVALERQITGYLRIK